MTKYLTMIARLSASWWSNETVRRLRDKMAVIVPSHKRASRAGHLHGGFSGDELYRESVHDSEEILQNMRGARSI